MKVPRPAPNPFNRHWWYGDNDPGPAKPPRVRADMSLANQVRTRQVQERLDRKAFTDQQRANMRAAAQRQDRGFGGDTRLAANPLASFMDKLTRRK